ncbi:tetratricopeptide repeat protein [Polaromonas jejuensis]|uniref:Tetratricopeptide repeat protein n=1 Tax=Polaromonas jejuensis TaxID=457502 RepID=A0ABW0QI39_9BURK|nr:HEAT repeat domain-containing protein [Polaromonas jejuensis]
MLRALILCIVLATITAAQPLPAASPPSTRQQALKAIENPDPAVRRAAVVRLSEIGAMMDADRLVAHLRDDDAPVRQLAEAALWQIWSRSGDRAIDALFLRGVQQMAASELTEALATFSEIIRKKPAFAEGWNKRATIYYLLGQYELSMKDCDEVLKRNSKHFGALSGYGQIYLALGDPDRAQPYLERALRVNPNMAGVATTIRLIEQQREEKRRRTI